MHIYGPVLKERTTVFGSYDDEKHHEDVCSVTSLLIHIVSGEFVDFSENDGRPILPYFAPPSSHQNPLISCSFPGSFTAEIVKRRQHEVVAAIDVVFFGLNHVLAALSPAILQV